MPGLSRCSRLMKRVWYKFPSLPDWMSRFVSTAAGVPNCRTLQHPSNRFVARAVSNICVACARFMANGFSHRTCLLVDRAVQVSSQWVEGGVATTTISPGSAGSASIMDASSNGRACGNCTVNAANACGSGSATESSTYSGSRSTRIALACALAIMPAPIMYILRDDKLFPLFLFYYLASPISH